jgi:hypothetical protein
VLLPVGNYLYQLMHGRHWDVALERRFFQVSALVVFLILDSLIRYFRVE